MYEDYYKELDYYGKYNYKSVYNFKEKLLKKVNALSEPQCKEIINYLKDTIYVLLNCKLNPVDISEDDFKFGNLDCLNYSMLQGEDFTIFYKKTGKIRNNFAEIVVNKLGPVDEEFYDNAYLFGEKNKIAEFLLENFKINIQFEQSPFIGKTSYDKYYRN